MTEAEMVGLFIESTQALDSNFQFWLSITFATLVAAYLASERIPITLKIVAVVLYALVSTLFFARHLTMANTLFSLSEQIIALDSETYVVSTGENAFIGLLYLITFVVGSLSTISYVLFVSRKKGGDG